MKTWNGKYTGEQLDQSAIYSIKHFVNIVSKNVVVFSCIIYSLQIELTMSDFFHLKWGGGFYLNLV